MQQRGELVLILRIALFTRLIGHRRIGYLRPPITRGASTTISPRLRRSARPPITRGASTSWSAISLTVPMVVLDFVASDRPQPTPKGASFAAVKPLDRRSDRDEDVLQDIRSIGLLKIRSPAPVEHQWRVKIGHPFPRLGLAALQSRNQMAGGAAERGERRTQHLHNFAGSSIEMQTGMVSKSCRGPSIDKKPCRYIVFPFGSSCSGETAPTMPRTTRLRLVETTWDRYNTRPSGYGGAD